MGVSDMELSQKRKRCNIEWKARCSDLENVQSRAIKIGAEFRGILQQRDTYFTVATGRLKLRETEQEPAQLVWYKRSNESVARPSHYILVPVDDASLLKRALEAALGIRAGVEKERRLLMYRNVRIHLDRVVNLGTFLELEAVVLTDKDHMEAHGMLSDLRRSLKIEESDLLPLSYSEMILSLSE